jgi:hypothetical protein
MGPPMITWHEREIVSDSQAPFLQRILMSQSAVIFASPRLVFYDPYPMLPIRVFLLAICIGLCGISSSVSTTHAQMRTRTEPPYSTVSKSVSWIVNVPYVTGGGPEQQLDLIFRLIVTVNR